MSTPIALDKWMEQSHAGNQKLMPLMKLLIPLNQDTSPGIPLPSFSLSKFNSLFCLKITLLKTFLQQALVCLIQSYRCINQETAIERTQIAWSTAPPTNSWVHWFQPTDISLQIVISWWSTAVRGLYVTLSCIGIWLWKTSAKTSLFRLTTQVHGFHPPTAHAWRQPASSSFALDHFCILTLASHVVFTKAISGRWQGSCCLEASGRCGTYHQYMLLLREGVGMLWRSADQGINEQYKNWCFLIWDAWSLTPGIFLNIDRHSWINIPILRVCAWSD